MKKIISFILTAAMLFSLAACAPVSKNSIEPAVYRMEDAQYPRLSLEEDGTFRLVYTSMASRKTTGTYSVADKVLKLVADDGAVYCFDISRKSIEFNAELSDEFIKVYNNEPDIVDGTEFELWRTIE